MKTVTKPKPQLEDRLGRLPANRAAPVPVPAPVQEVPTVEKLLQRLVTEIQSRQPAAVTKPKSPLDQLEDLLGRLLVNRTAPVQEVPMGGKLLQCLVDELQSRQLAAVTKPKPPLDQLEDLLGRLLANSAAPVPVPAPVQEVPMVEKFLQHLVAEIQNRQPAAVTKPKPPLDQLGDLLGRFASEQGCPGSGPSSGSGGADGRMAAATSGGGVTESPAGGCEFDRARGVEIVSLRTADTETTDSAEISQKRSECRRMFFMRRVGSFCSPLPRSG